MEANGDTAQQIRVQGVRLENPTRRFANPTETKTRTGADEFDVGIERAPIGYPPPPPPGFRNSATGAGREEAHQWRRDRSAPPFPARRTRKGYMMGFQFARMILASSKLRERPPPFRKRTSAFALTRRSGPKERK